MVGRTSAVSASPVGWNRQPARRAKAKLPREEATLVLVCCRLRLADETHGQHTVGAVSADAPPDVLARIVELARNRAGY
jgi:hypothetical protein